MQGQEQEQAQELEKAREQEQEKKQEKANTTVPTDCILTGSPQSGILPQI